MVTNVLKNVQFVVDSSGKESAVQINIEDWRKIIDYFEELEDRASVKELLHCLKVGPEKSGALAWGEARDQW